MPRPQEVDESSSGSDDEDYNVQLSPGHDDLQVLTAHSPGTSYSPPQGLPLCSTYYGFTLKEPSTKDKEIYDRY